MEFSDLYAYAKQRYAAFGVDCNEAVMRLINTPISIHCWQGDDVRGFEGGADSLGGGIQTTGNYPGRARNFDELTQDFDVALRLIPGTKRLNLHASYALTHAGTERDELTFDDFAPWVEYAKQRNIKIDFNSTLFGHEYASDGLTLSHPDEEIRQFWIRHVKACRKIAAEIGREQGSPCLHNLWIPDGLKDEPADRLGPRMRLKESLDEIYKIQYDKKRILDSVESKVFGIGVESYTVGSAEFYNYYAAKNGVYCLLDNGHFHPTENVADKISTALLFADKVALHVTRSVRWDSDHVVTLNDDVKAIARELVACKALDRTLIGLDYFDASINRVAAWVIGTRSFQAALLHALLMPHEQLKKLQDERDYTRLLAYTEELKTLPFDIVWQHYLTITNTPINWLKHVESYEKEVLANRE